MNKVSRKRQAGAIEVTPAMIEAGVAAWREVAGDEFPDTSTTNDEVVEVIFRAMAIAAL